MLWVCDIKSKSNNFYQQKWEIVHNEISSNDRREIEYLYINSHARARACVCVCVRVFVRHQLVLFSAVSTSSGRTNFNISASNPVRSLILTLLKCQWLQVILCLRNPTHKNREEIRNFGWGGGGGTWFRIGQGLDKSILCTSKLEWHTLMRGISDCQYVFSSLWYSSLPYFCRCETGMSGYISNIGAGSCSSTIL